MSELGVFWSNIAKTSEIVGNVDGETRDFSDDEWREMCAEEGLDAAFPLMVEGMPAADLSA